jgi:hypothetical protein
METRMRLWVLLFNADSDNQGIYTRLEAGKNIVLAFVQEDDAIRYAGLLEAQDFPSAVTESIDERELTEICQDTGLGLNIVREDELVIPPTTNVDKTEWDDFSEQIDNDDDNNIDMSPAALEIEIMRRKLEGLL